MTSLIAILVSGALALPQAGPPARDAAEIAALIEAAPPGATIRVPAGVYRGRIRIEKPITIEGAGQATIDGGGDGDIVEIASPSVTVRGLTIRGTGISLDHENCGIRVLAGAALIEDNTLEDILFGIDLKAAPGSVLRRNRIGGKNLDIARRGDGIRLWSSPGCVLEENVIHDGRDAILWYSDRVLLKNNHVYDGRYGLHFMYSHDTVLEGNILEDNSVGVYIMYSNGIVLRKNVIARNRGPSGYALGLKDADRFTVERNALTGNRVGVYIDNSPFTLDGFGDFHDNRIAYNDIALTFLPSVKRNTFTNNAFIDNVEQVSIAGGGELRDNAFAVNGRGNYWSDYGGYDLNHDGVGDMEYASQSLFESLIDREPRLRFFLYSPAQDAVELASRAMPSIVPRTKITDPSPLMSPVALDLGPTEHASPAGTLAAAGTLVLVGFGIFAGWRLVPPARLPGGRP